MIVGIVIGLIVGVVIDRLWVASNSVKAEAPAGERKSRAIRESWNNLKSSDLEEMAQRYWQQGLVEWKKLDRFWQIFVIALIGLVAFLISPALLVGVILIGALVALAFGMKPKDGQQVLQPVSEFEEEIPDYPASDVPSEQFNADPVNLDLTEGEK